MSKRSNEFSQLSKEELAMAHRASADPSSRRSAGPWGSHVATPEQMEQRRVIRVQRPPPSSSSSQPPPPPESEQTAEQNSSSSSASRNPFATFSFLGSNNNNNNNNSSAGTNSMTLGTSLFAAATPTWPSASHAPTPAAGAASPAAPFTWGTGTSASTITPSFSSAPAVAGKKSTPDSLSLYRTKRQELEQALFQVLRTREDIPADLLPRFRQFAENLRQHTGVWPAEAPVLKATDIVFESDQVKTQSKPKLTNIHVPPPVVVPPPAAPASAFFLAANPVPAESAPTNPFLPPPAQVAAAADKDPTEEGDDEQEPSQEKRFILAVEDSDYDPLDSLGKVKAYCQNVPRQPNSGWKSFATGEWILQKTKITRPGDSTKPVGYRMLVRDDMGKPRVNLRITADMTFKLESRPKQLADLTFFGVNDPERGYELLAMRGREGNMQQALIRLTQLVQDLAGAK